VTETVELVEYQAAQLPLSDADARWLMGHEPRRFEVLPVVGNALWQVQPGPTVGIVELPSGLRLRCNPKAPVRNVFFMLATAYGLRSPFLDQAIAFQRIDELFDFLVEHLANLVEERLEHGLYRAYVEREDNLPAVRGRIMIAEDLRRNAVLRQRTMCQFTEFTWDIPENRIIRQTIYAMSRLVHSHQLQLRLAALDRALGEIDPTPLPLSRFDSFHYHRLNDDYRPIHRLCRLLLEGASVSEHAGGVGFRAFLLDMNQLYERFLTVSLESALGGDLRLESQWERTLDMDRRVMIRPDLVVLRGATPLVIADAKYKLSSGAHQGHADLYQLLAYCTAEQVRHGVLIYPRWEFAGETTVRVRNSPVEIERFAIDLGGSIENVRAEVQRLAMRLRRCATEDDASCSLKLAG
jgi:5-methylcytosine-specific restriction enzyme subunit McrC